MNTYIVDIILAIVFFIYPFFLMIASKGLGMMGMRKDSQRKFIHSAMGLVILFVPLFTHLWIVLIPPILFVITNALDYRFGWISEMSGEDKGNIGTILYPISYLVLIWVFFHTRWWGLAVLGILTMAFGDAGASVVGRAFGKITAYSVNGEPRTYAGSIAMFCITFVVALVVFLVYGGQMGLTMRFLTLMSASFLVAAMATIIEALSTKGSDNITVPVLTALTAWFLIAVMMQNVLGNQAIVNQPVFQ
jgi:dolichol kinase